MPDLPLLRNLIRQAVSDNLDIGNTGVVVSGGVDSSTVCAIALQLSEGLGDLPTFTGYYDTEGFDERPYARLVGGANHHEILITPQDFIDNFDAMVPKLRPPYQGMGTFGQYMVGKFIAENFDVKVILSGEGSDELFGGYARLIAVAAEDGYSDLSLPDGYENYKIPVGYPRRLKAALDYDWQRLPDLLAVDDQCMAAHGLEARAPFTESPIIKYAHDLFDYERVGKTVLKDAMRGIVPDAILDRTDKKGFPIPLVKWAQGPIRDFVGDRIGYIPDPHKPWDRGWWYDLLEGKRAVAA